VLMGIDVVEREPGRAEGGELRLDRPPIRIAHVGYMGAFDVITAIAALEMALRKFGAEIPFGRGVAAAQEVLMEALN